MTTRGCTGIERGDTYPQGPLVSYSLVLGGSIVQRKAATALLAKRPGVTAVFRTAGPFSEIVQYCRRIAPAVLLIDQASVESATPLELNALLDLREE
mgnify:CR=1 FL=1